MAISQGLTADKILPFWVLRILKDVAGVGLKNLDKVPIPVDLHIAQSDPPDILS
jgi:hypothetical protein